MAFPKPNQWNMLARILIPKGEKTWSGNAKDRIKKQEIILVSTLLIFAEIPGMPIPPLPPGFLWLMVTSVVWRLESRSYSDACYGFIGVLSSRGAILAGVIGAIAVVLALHIGSILAVDPFGSLLFAFGCCAARD